MSFFIVVPAAVTYYGATAIGTAVASFIGIGSVTAATATAIGAATIGATFSALKGDKPEDILKNAVLGGITSYVGGTVGKTVSQSVSKNVAQNLISSGVSQSTANAMATVLGSASSAAITGGTSALLQGKNPIDAMLKSGLTATLSGGIGLAVDKVTGSIPGFSDLSSTASGAALSRATSSAIATSVLGGDASQAFGSSLIDSFIKTVGPDVKNALKDAGTALKDSASKVSSAQDEINNNIIRQQAIAKDYEDTISPLQKQQDAAQTAIDKYNDYKNKYDNYYTVYNRSEEEEDDLGDFRQRGFRSIWVDDEGNRAPDKSTLLSRANSAAEAANGLIEKFNADYSTAKPKIDSLDADFKSVKATYDTLKSDLDNTYQPALDAALDDFNKTEYENTALISEKLQDYQKASDKYKELYGRDPTAEDMGKVIKSDTTDYVKAIEERYKVDSPVIDINGIIDNGLKSVQLAGLPAAAVNVYAESAFKNAEPILRRVVEAANDPNYKVLLPKIEETLARAGVTIAELAGRLAPATLAATLLTYSPNAGDPNEAKELADRFKNYTGYNPTSVLLPSRPITPTPATPTPAPPANVVTPISTPTTGTVTDLGPLPPIESPVEPPLSELVPQPPVVTPPVVEVIAETPPIRETEPEPVVNPDDFSSVLAPPPRPNTEPSQTPTVAPTPTITPEPFTPAPVTPAPVTPAPVTPAPVTPAPVTPAPVTPTPVTPTPVTPTPVTPTPVVPEPVKNPDDFSTILNPTPVSPVTPVTPVPVSPTPVVPEPVTPIPVTPTPVIVTPETPVTTPPPVAPVTPPPTTPEPEPETPLVPITPAPPPPDSTVTPVVTPPPTTPTKPTTPTTPTTPKAPTTPTPSNKYTLPTTTEPTYSAKEHDLLATWLGGTFTDAAPKSALAALLMGKQAMNQENQLFSALRQASGEDAEQSSPNSGFYSYGSEPSASEVLAPYMHGGTVHTMATGGKMVASPLMAAATGGDAEHKGSHYVQGAGGGQDDLIPAKLADGEYVLDAEIVAALGDGSNKRGAEILDKWRESIRKHKRSGPIGTIPPKAKSPLAYMKGIK